MKKRMLLFVPLLIILITITGCGFFEKSYSINERRDKVLNYLEKKYGEEFLFKSIEPNSWAYSHDKLYCYPKNGTEEDMFVVWGTLMDGSYIIRDGYYGILIKEDYEKLMSSFVKGIYKDFVLETKFGEAPLPDRLNKKTKVSEIFNKDELFISDTNLFVKESSAENIDSPDALEKIAHKMIINKLVGRVTLYIVYDSSFYLVNSGSIFDRNIKDHTYKYIIDSGKTISVNKSLNIYKYWEDK